MAEKQNTPEIRFEGFTDPWEQRKWSEYVSISTDMVDPRSGNYDNLPHVGPGNMESFTGRLYDNVNTVKDDALISGKFHFNPGDIIYGKINPQLGKYTYAQFEGLASADAYVLNGKNGLTQEFLFGILQTKAFFDYSVSVSMRSGMPKINRDELNAFEFLAPNESEQRAIGDILLKLDDLITLHQRKHDKLCTLKKSMLDKMFPKPGETEPEIRFEGFTDPWEQRKFSDLVLIERGGSPRPIDAYITEDPAGLNWVKIGDAPSMGRYITTTSEKIKPEGLSKTRQVYPGDLVLSNSMSFGRPYIMAVEGCIHDGWLLIRDTQNQFDPVFLCHMLGTPQMLDQYRMFASGSTVNNLNKELVGNAMVPLPDRDEQVKIGNYLDELDGLITLHQRKLELLRNIKKSLLDRMFV